MAATFERIGAHALLLRGTEGEPVAAPRPHPLFRPGTVTLVGAGPGDPELLTLKAVRAIEAATVLLVDDRASGAGVARRVGRLR